jgi:hypothetical protein
VHDGRRLPIGGSPERDSVEESSLAVEKLGPQVCQPIEFGHQVIDALQEHGHVIVGVRRSIAAGAGAEQHRPIKRRPVQLQEGAAEAGEDWFVNYRGHHVVHNNNR